MENKKIHIDNLYREKQEQFTELPPAAWADMEKKLDKSSPNGGFSQWYWYGLVIVFVGILTYYGVTKYAGGVTDNNTPTAGPSVPQKIKTPDGAQYQQTHDSAAASKLAASEENSTFNQNSKDDYSANGTAVVRHSRRRSHNGTAKTGVATNTRSARIAKNRRSQKASSSQDIVTAPGSDSSIQSNSSVALANNVASKNFKAGRVNKSKKSISSAPAVTDPVGASDVGSKSSSSETGETQATKNNRKKKKQAETDALTAGTKQGTPGTAQSGPGNKPQSKAIGVQQGSTEQVVVSGSNTQKQSSKAKRSKNYDSQTASSDKGAKVDATNTALKSTGAKAASAKTGEQLISSEPAVPSTARKETPENTEVVEKQATQNSSSDKSSTATSQETPGSKPASQQKGEQPSASEPAAVVAANKNEQVEEGKEQQRKSAANSDPTAGAQKKKPGTAQKNAQVGPATIASNDQAGVPEPAAPSVANNKKAEPIKNNAVPQASTIKPKSRSSAKASNTQPVAEPWEEKKRDYLKVKPDGPDDESETAGSPGGATGGSGRVSSLIDEMDKQKIRNKSKFEFGVKAGYEFGWQDMPINKFVAGGLFQYYLSNRFTIGIEPAIKSGSLSSINTPANQAYYSPTGTTSTWVYRDSFNTPGTITPPSWTKYYTHNYDSITVSYQSSNKVLEFEVPLVLGYHTPDGFGLSAGLNFIKGKTVAITMQKQTFANFQQMDSSMRFPGNIDTATQFVDTSNFFHHSAALYSPNSGADIQSPSVNPMRVGVLVGFNYSRKNWLVELVLHQNISSLGEIQNAQIRKSYSQPYVRLMFGLKIGK
jgi:hypothetical protein